MSAGIDTTAHTATFLLYHLATNPDKQEILYKEICDVIGREGKMTEAKLTDMKYLKVNKVSIICRKCKQSCTNYN